MEPTIGLPEYLPRWLCFVVVWILLSLLFASQLYWSGYAPWPTALWLEAAHWLSWGIVSPLVFWLCRKLYQGERAWPRHLGGLLFGAFVICLLQPALTQSIVFVSNGLQWLLTFAEAPPRSFLSTLHLSAVKVAGYNLPVYAGLVLAWHAMTYYKQLRDRQLEAMELEALLHQAQLQTLRTQLNPHFLFNTLHSIAELVHGNPRLAEQLILRLGEMKRGEDFGVAYGENRSGEWEYAGYRLDGSYTTPPEKSVECAACHRKAGPENDFVFRMDTARARM